MQAQFADLEARVNHYLGQFWELANEVALLMWCIDEEALFPASREEASTDDVLQRARGIWGLFQAYTRAATTTVVAHSLAVLRWHYPRVDMERVREGFAANTSSAERGVLESDAELAAIVLVNDVDLFEQGP